MISDEAVEAANCPADVLAAANTTWKNIDVTWANLAECRGYLDT